MSPSLKAGLIGAAAAVVLSLLRMVPILGCIALLLELALYVGVGVLAAYWMKAPWNAGKGAGQGAVAGLIAGLGGGLTNVIATTIRYAVRGQSAYMRQFRQLPPALLEQWRDLGIDPGMLASPSLVIGSSAVCCGLSFLLAAALGAVGGAIAASIRKEPPAPAEPVAPEEPAF